ncbi:hypothetical protein [Bifidobacterium saimiriisciurei]|nr:hypothetical protein [Bifidobacterium saimiriisciurei]NEH10552.1 hypothetical protein [Bifidobacterium saimiriisciurei]NEH10665.1 hypothetical protein [Bifidobacterium saimiriisciurei]
MLIVAMLSLLAYTVIRFTWLVSSGIGGQMTLADIVWMLGLIVVVAICIYYTVRNIRLLRRGVTTARGIIWMFNEIHSTDSDGDPTTRFEYTIRLERGDTLKFAELPVYGRIERLMKTPGTHIILRWIEDTDIIDLIEPDPGYPQPNPYDVVEERRGDNANRSAGSGNASNNRNDDADKHYTVVRRMATSQEHEWRTSHMSSMPYGATTMPYMAPAAQGTDGGNGNADDDAAWYDAKRRYAVLLNPPTMLFFFGLVALTGYQLGTMSPFGVERVMQDAVVFVSALVFAVWMIIHMLVQGPSLAHDDIYRHEPRQVRSRLLRRNIVRHCIGIVVFLAIGLSGLSGVFGTLQQGPVTKPVTFSSFAHHTETDDDDDETEYADFTFTDALGEEIGISVESSHEEYILRQTGERTGRGLVLTYWDLGHGNYAYDHARPNATTE